MKVLFDNQKFTTDTHGGIVRYFAELMRHYDGMQGIEYDMPIAYSNVEFLRAIPRFKNLQQFPKYEDFLPKLKLRGKGRLYRLWNRFFLGKDNYSLSIASVNKGDFDILHPTYYDSSLLDHLKDKPYVLTVYDMIHELFPSEYTASDKTVVDKRELVKCATRIIAISENTKNDLVKILGVKPDKVDVVYLANSLIPEHGKHIDSELFPKNYILFVGSRTRYKNFQFFVKAIAALLKEQEDLYLVCAGSSEFDASEKDLFDKEGIVHKVLHRNADDKKLTGYYMNALAFIFPSLYEGFGIPVLEAFACNCPAVISNSSSLSEVGGDAVAYFNPNDKDDIYNSIKNVISSQITREEMILAGQKRLQQFSWQKTAEETVAVYKKALLEHHKGKMA